ncbi:MAG: hypothetical protein ACTSU8_01710 [Alphaproteobacteria bacterium]
MNKNKQTKLILLNALAWAGAILAASYFTKGLVDKDTGFMITMFLIAGWFTANGFLTAGKGSIQKDWACIKRRLGKS